jgi:hypothetical protein
MNPPVEDVARHGSFAWGLRPARDLRRRRHDGPDGKKYDTLCQSPADSPAGTKVSSHIAPVFTDYFVNGFPAVRNDR